MAEVHKRGSVILMDRLGPDISRLYEWKDEVYIVRTPFEKFRVGH